MILIALLTLILGSVVAHTLVQRRIMKQRADAFLRWALTCYDGSVPFEVDNAHIQPLNIQQATVHPHLADRFH